MSTGPTNAVAARRAPAAGTQPPREEFLLPADKLLRLDHYLDAVNRRPDWKWVRAARIIKQEDDLPSVQLDGSVGCRMIRSVLAFRKQVDSLRSYSDCRVLQSRFPALYRAYEIYADRRTSARWALEANLLTQRTYDDISHHLRLPISVVDMYESVFFNVRDRLQNVGYIRDQIIQAAYHTRKGDLLEWDYIWKLYAYFYGHYMLDAIISSVTNPVQCNIQSSVEQILKDDVEGALTIQASHAVRSDRLQSTVRIKLLKAYIQYDSAKKDPKGDGTQNAITSGIYTLVQSMPLKFGVMSRNEEFAHRPYLLSDYEVGPQQELAAVLHDEPKKLGLHPGLTFDKLIEENSATDVVNDC